MYGKDRVGKGSKKNHYIAPIIIIMVCSSFNGDVEILVEEDIEGDRVHAHMATLNLSLKETERWCALSKPRKTT